jgi:hypothetical protein
VRTLLKTQLNVRDVQLKGGGSVLDLGPGDIEPERSDGSEASLQAPRILQPIIGLDAISAPAVKRYPPSGDYACRRVPRPQACQSSRR